jgi:hypothetical protein
MNSITSLVIGLDAILFLICGVRIYQAFLKGRDKSVGYFAKFFVLAGIGFIIMATADKITLQLFAVKCLIIIGLFLLLTGMAYFTKLTISLVKPRLENAAFWAIMIGNILTASAMIRFYLFASTRKPFFDQQTGALILNFPSIVTLLFFIMIFATMIVPGIIFVAKTFSSRDKKTKIKGILISSGLIFFGIGSLFCTMSRQVFSMQISHIFLVLAFLPFLVGVFYVTEKKIPEIGYLTQDNPVLPKDNL